MTIADKQTPLFTVTVDGVEWFATEENPTEFYCRAPGLGFFHIKDFGPGDSIFKGWTALEVGCGIGVKDVGSAEEAMKQVAPRIRERAAEIVERESEHLKQAKAGAKAVGAS
jgi:hypothetical protein